VEIGGIGRLRNAVVAQGCPADYALS